MRKDEATVSESAAKIGGLQKLMKDIDGQRGQLEKERDGFTAISKKISSFVDTINQAEQKMERLGDRLSTIDKVERRLNDLSIMSDDVNAKIDAMKDEEKTIERAGKQTVELKFLLGEIEKKLKEYFNSKGGKPEVTG